MFKEWLYEMSKQVCPGGEIADIAECVAPATAVAMIQRLERQYIKAEANGEDDKAHELLLQVEDLKSKLSFDSDCVADNCKCHKEKNGDDK